MSPRHQLIRELQRLIEARESPRLYMALLIAITGLTGFVASFILLNLGLHTLWLRYLIAGGLAYLLFLALLHEWTHRRGADGIDLSGLPSGSEPCGADNPDTTPNGSPPTEGDLPLDAEAAPLFLLILLLALAASCAWIITSAPQLLAEMMLDSAVAAGVYRRLRHRDRRSWIDTAVRGTYRPFLMVVLVLMAIGWTAQQLHPEVETLGQFLRL